MNIIIKRAKIEDLAIIQKLNNEVFVASQKYDCYLNMKWPFEKEGIKYFTNAIKGRKYCVLIAWLDDKPVGYLIGVERNYSYRVNRVAEIDNMGVTEDYRGKGIGTLLVNEFKKWCQKRGITHIKVNTYFNYQKAINFYKKQGLKPIDVTLEGEINL
jgi:GNAT superfamily N-acetyltransferase